jgi:hypothetical protein
VDLEREERDHPQLHLVAGAREFFSALAEHTKPHLLRGRQANPVAEEVAIPRRGGEIGVRLLGGTQRLTEEPAGECVLGPLELPRDSDERATPGVE